MAEDQQHLESVGVTADENARVEVRQYALGGGTIALGTCVDLAGNRSQADVLLRYHARRKDVLDINHVVRQRGRNTRAEVSESGALDDAARKTLRATIDLVHGARGSKGNEAESVLVLGDDVVNKTMPVILCDEDDVAGNHGATIGSVSPEQIDYLMDRGLSRREAEQLFVRAIFEDAIMHAPEEASHRAAVLRAEEVLGADVAHDFDEGLTKGQSLCQLSGLAVCVAVGGDVEVLGGEALDKLMELCELCLLLVLLHCGKVGQGGRGEDGLLRVDGRSRAHGQGDGVGGAGVQVLVAAVCGDKLHLGVERGAADRRHADAGDLSAERRHGVDQKVVRHGPAALGALHAHADGRGLDRSDANGQLDGALAGLALLRAEDHQGGDGASADDDRLYVHPSE